jgi:hypothetical protein
LILVGATTTDGASMSDSTVCVGGALGLPSGGDGGERFEAARSGPEHAEPLAMMNENARTRRNVGNSNLFRIMRVFRVGADCGQGMSSLRARIAFCRMEV